MKNLNLFQGNTMRKGTRLLSGVFAKAALLFILLVLVSACASRPRGPLVLMPEGKAEQGYSSVERQWVFEYKSVFVKTGRLTKADSLPASGLIDMLLDSGYTVMRMEIKNGSKARVIFNPSLTALMDDSMGYFKPLDYTDIYEMAGEDPEKTGFLKDVRRLFYDLTATVEPGETSSKLLIFRPLSRNAGAAELIIKDLYIGTDALNLRFPFALKPEAITP